MNSVEMGLVTFCSILIGTAIGFYLGGNLPKHHLDSDSKDTIKVAWGSVATMAALVLSLLLASAKSSFDTVNNENIHGAAQVIVLDRLLARYGPETKEARIKLKTNMAVTVQKIWPESAKGVSASSVLETRSGVEQVQDELDALVPQNESQRTLLAQAKQMCSELLQSRWLVVEQTRTGLPQLLFAILVLWLTLLFIGLGLFAPRNKTVLTVLLLCNLSFSTAIFVISELNRPLDGIMKISSAPMLKALEHLGEP